MAKPEKYNINELNTLQGVVNITTPNGKKLSFKSGREALEHLRKNTPEGYNVYDATRYARNYNPEVNERYSKKELKEVEAQRRLDERNETARMYLEMIPGIGDALDWYNTGEAVYNIGDYAYRNKGNMKGFNTDNYYTAGFGILSPFIPNIIEKPLKGLYKAGKNTIKGVKRQFKRTPKRQTGPLSNLELETPEVNDYSPFTLNDNVETTPVEVVTQESNPILEIDNMEITPRPRRPRTGRRRVDDFSWGNILQNINNQSTRLPDPPSEVHIDIPETSSSRNTFFDSPNLESPQRFSIPTYGGRSIEVDLSGENPTIEGVGLFDFTSLLPYMDLNISNLMNNPLARNLFERIKAHPTFLYMNDRISEDTRLEQWLDLRTFRRDLSEPVKLDNGWNIDAVTGNAISPEGFFISKYSANKNIVPEKPHHYSDDYVKSKLRRTSEEPMEGPVFTKENFPGQDRTKLFSEAKDVTSMAHFDIPPEDYQKIMTLLLERTPHGAAIGFSHNGDISTSSAAMFPLQLIKGYNNGTLGMIFNPVGETGNRTLRLNTSGRMYTKTPKGLRAVQGTENMNFRSSVYDPNGLSYIPGTSVSINPTRISESPKLKPTISLASKQDWVDWFNKTRVEPLNERVKLIRPDELFPEAFVDKFGNIHVPNMAGVRLKNGGSINPILNNTNIIGI